jgi:hypothetical protein
MPARCAAASCCRRRSSYPQRAPADRQVRPATRLRAQGRAGQGSWWSRLRRRCGAGPGACAPGPSPQSEPGPSVRVARAAFGGRSAMPPGRTSRNRLARSLYQRHRAAPRGGRPPSACRPAPSGPAPPARGVERMGRYRGTAEQVRQELRAKGLNAPGLMRAGRDAPSRSRPAHPAVSLAGWARPRGQGDRP